MAIPAINTVIGGASANSYISLDDADIYLDSRLNSEAWADANSDDKTRALLMAAARLERENWLGNRATTTQRLAWPRFGAEKVDPASLGYGLGGYYAGWGWTYGEPYLTTEIPQPVKDAQCELALAYLEGFEADDQEAMDSFSQDGVSVKLRQTKPDGGLPPRVSQLIGGLVAGNRLIRA